MTRVVFRPNDGGREFVVYFDVDAEIPKAAEVLRAVEVRRQSADSFQLLCEQIDALEFWDDVAP